MKVSKKVVRMGMDLGKNTFHVFGVGESGSVVVKKKLRRRQVLEYFANLPPCLVGMEACGSSHHWARELIKLGHEVKLISPPVCEAVCQGEQERLQRCGRDL